MQFKLNKIINSEELKNNKYFKGSVEIALLNALYKEKEIDDREYREIKGRIKKSYNLF